MISMYDLEVQRAVDEIKRHSARKVLIQLPDGLRPMAFSLAEELKQKTGAEVFLSGDSCYGACDLALHEAEVLDVNLILHYGHSRMVDDRSIPVVYIEVRMDFDAEVLVGKAMPHINGWSRIGLAATVQHVHKLGEVAEILRFNGLTPFIGRRGEGTPHNGQVLGCQYVTALDISDKVEGFIYIGAGRFHPLGLATITGKPVVIANPYTMSADMLDEHEVMRLAMKRMAAIKSAEEACVFGIVVSLKPGQYQLDIARQLVRRMEEAGKKATIICLDEVGSQQLENFTEPEAFISTACPRIAIDGVAGMTRPILMTTEAQVLLGDRRWEEIWGHNYIR